MTTKHTAFLSIDAFGNIIGNREGLLKLQKALNKMVSSPRACVAQYDSDTLVSNIIMMEAKEFENL